MSGLEVSIILVAGSIVAFFACLPIVTGATRFNYEEWESINRLESTRNVRAVVKEKYCGGEDDFWLRITLEDGDYGEMIQSRDCFAMAGIGDKVTIDLVTVTWEDGTVTTSFDKDTLIPVK